MEIHLTWKTKFFSSIFELFKYDIPVGIVSNKNRSRKSVCKLNDKEFLFETKGIFKAETRITELSDNKELGNIVYSAWRRKSTIFLYEKEYYWKYDNFFNTRWSISDRNGYLVKYHAHGLKGTILSYIDNDPLILAGFFIRNYYKQKAEAAAAAST